VDKVATAERKTFPCGYTNIGPITGRIMPMHSHLYFLDFVSADGKRLLVEDKICVGRDRLKPSQDPRWDWYFGLHGGILLFEFGQGLG
jgi:hypothetical protein